MKAKYPRSEALNVAKDLCAAKILHFPTVKRKSRNKQFTDWYAIHFRAPPAKIHYTRREIEAIATEHQLMKLDAELQAHQALKKPFKI